MHVFMTRSVDQLRTRSTLPLVGCGSLDSALLRRSRSVRKGVERPRSASGGPQPYGRGREVHAWQTLTGAVDKTVHLIR